MDAQGAVKARPYVEKAGATFITLVDQENVLGPLFGFKAIPNGIFIDEQGAIRYIEVGGFDIRRRETAELVGQWAAGPGLPKLGPVVDTGPSNVEARESIRLFREGLRLYRNGAVEQAMDKWRQGLERDPANYIIRKQIWAVESPGKFYDGDIDYDWQREQMAASEPA